MDMGNVKIGLNANEKRRSQWQMRSQDQRKPQRQMKLQKQGRSHSMRSALAMLLVIVMVFTMMPVGAFGESKALNGDKGNSDKSGGQVLMKGAGDGVNPDGGAGNGVNLDGDVGGEANPESAAETGENPADNAGDKENPEGGASDDENPEGNAGDEENPESGVGDKEDPESGVGDEENPESGIGDEENPEGDADGEEEPAGNKLTFDSEYPLELEGAISITMWTHIVRADYRKYVAIKIKNTSAETIEDVTLIDSTKLTAVDTFGSEYDYTPYELNETDDYNWDDTYQPKNATANAFGYDIAAGETATFYLRVQSGDLKKGTYNHFIQLGKKERKWEGGSTWVEPVATYSGQIPVTLKTYDPPVKITMGKLNSDYSVTAKDAVDFGTINLKTEAEANNGPITKSTTFAVRNSSTAEDEVTGEVPSLYISMADAYIYDKKYGRLPFNFNKLYYETWTELGPDAPSWHDLNLNVSDMIAGTYYGTIRANVSPGVVTVNGTKNTEGWGKRWGFFDIPVRATLTGTNPNLPAPAENLRAVAGNDMAELSWDEPDGFDGYYNVYRRDGTETEDDWTKYNYEPYEFLGSVNSYSGQTTYVDATAKNDRTYSYMIITGADGAEPYHGYPSNTATCTPDETKDRRILAPELGAYSNAGFVYLSWNYNDEPTMRGSNCEGVIDHFNVYKNGKLEAQVSQSAWGAEESYDWDDDGNKITTRRYSWGFQTVTPPGAQYAWEIAAVNESGIEGYRSEVQIAESYRAEPVIDGHMVMFYDNYWFNENGRDFYYDPKYGEGEGKGVFMCILIDEYYSNITFMNIYRKKADDSGYTLIAERVPKNYVNGGRQEFDFCDRSAAYSTTYKYKVIGTYGDEEETNAYEFTVKTPAKGNDAEYSQANVTYDILKGTMPRLQFSVQNDEGGTSQFKLMRKGPENTDWVVEKTYSVSGDTISYKTYTDTPMIDGIYSYRLDKVTNGILIKGHEYTYIRDTSDTDEALLPKKPSAPRLTASIVNEDVMLRWSSTGSEQIDGYYLYRTENDKPNTNNWASSDGERNKDYPWDAIDRYMRFAPERTSYKDDVGWYGDYDYETETSTPQTHKWWIVAYNEYGASEPSEVITYTDQDNGEGGYEAPKNSETEAPGKPQIARMWVDYSQYDYSAHAPEDVNSYGYVHINWAESLDGGYPEYFDVKLKRQGGNEDSWRIYAGDKYEEKRQIYFPEGAGTYTATISCTNAAGTSQTASQTLRVCGPPKVLTKVTGKDSVLVEWTEPEEAGVTVSSYEVWRCDKYGIWSLIKTTGASVRSYEDKGLTAGAEYKYKVIAKCQDLLDRTSAIIEEKVTGKTIRCSAPQNLASRVLDGRLYLTWTPPETGTPDDYYYAIELDESNSYYNYWKTDNNGNEWPDGGSWEIINMYVKSDAKHWVYNDIPLDTDVRIKICARNDAEEDNCYGWGIWTEPITVKLTTSQASSRQKYLPAKVLPTITGGENKITITWKSTPKNSEYDGAAYYVIDKYKFVEGEDEEVLDTVFGDPTATSAKTYTYEDTDVEPGIDYRYRITAYNAAGRSYPNYWFTGRATGVTENDNKVALIRELLDELHGNVSAITTENYPEYEESIGALRGLYDGLNKVGKSMLEDEEKEQIEALIGKYDKARAQAEYAELITQADAFMATLPDPADLTAENIGEYREAVNNANAVLAKLPAEARAGVDTSRLDAIKAKLEEMKKIEADMKAAKAVSDKIDALPNAEDVTLMHKNLILNARAVYNRLTEDQKQYVNAETLAHLTACEEAIAPLLIKDAEDKIRNLPDPAAVTLADEDQINSAKDAFDILSDEDKAKVSDELRQKLENVLAALHELKRVPLAVSMATSKPAAVYYNGKAQKPGFVLKYNGDTLVSGVDYTAVYSNNKNVGKGKVVVTGTGDFKGTITFTFKINPKGLKLKKVYAGRKKAKVTWKALKTKMSKSRVTGYEIQYSRKSTMKSSKTKKVKGYKKSSVTIKKLKGKKVYYFRIRTYLKTGGKTYRSKWSAKKKIRVKK